MSNNEDFALCEFCNQIMNKTSCTLTEVKLNGKMFKRLVYKNEFRKEKHNCHDCGTSLNQLHHMGCDMEKCPSCKLQLISCDCFKNDKDVRSWMVN